MPQDPPAYARIAQSLPPNLQALYVTSVAHRIAHGCGAYSFEDGPGLYALAARLQPRRVLELGTALGYTAGIFATAVPGCQVDTIEADALHVQLARAQLAALQLSRVHVHCGRFEAVLPTLEGGFDIAFFDGFAPSLAILERLQALLAVGGHLVCGNLGLVKPREAQPLRAWLENSAAWQACPALENGATVVARKRV